MVMAGMGTTGMGTDVVRANEARVGAGTPAMTGGALRVMTWPTLRVPTRSLRP